jgi:DNA-binding GntR family transcriptional regulator
MAVRDIRSIVDSLRYHTNAKLNAVGLVLSTVDSLRRRLLPTVTSGNSSPQDAAFGAHGRFQKPVPISEMIFRHLAHEIVQGSMRPGERLTETKLCEEFNCSRSPLREAIRMLAAQGLVKIEPRRGARVVALSEKDVTDLYRLRSVLEGLAVRLAAESGTDEQFDELAALNVQMAEAVKQAEYGDYFDFNTAFHQRIAEAGGNNHVAMVQQTIAARSLAPLFQFGSSKQRLLTSVDDHEAILDALRQRDGDRAERIMRDHLNHAGEEAEQLIRSHAGPEPADTVDAD